MSRKWAAFVCAALSLTCAGPALAQAPAAGGAVAVDAAADRAAIEARLRELVGGMITRDPAAMEKLLASDFQAVTYGGRLVDRGADIAAVTASPDFEVKSVTTKDVDIRLYGDAAVVRALVAVIERRGEKTYSVPMRVTQTWIRQNGDWRAVADQATRVEFVQPAPPTAANPGSTGMAASADR